MSYDYYKSVIITGSTSGIGLAIAYRFAELGFRIMLNGLVSDGEESDRLVRDLGDRGAEDVLFSGADMRSPSAIRAMVEFAGGQWEHISILVNNAGIQHVSPIEEFSDGKWDDIIAINLSSVFHGSKAVIPYMRRSGFGRIVNIASAHGLVASPYKSAYVSSKHGVLGLTKTIALEVAGCGITCNALCPGFVDTPLVRGQLADLARVEDLSFAEVLDDVIVAKQPSRQLIPASDVANFVIFLCSLEAGHVSGSALPIDGGWTAQ